MKKLLKSIAYGFIGLAIAVGISVPAIVMAGNNQNAVTNTSGDKKVTYSYANSNISAKWCPGYAVSLVGISVTPDEDEWIKLTSMYDLEGANIIKSTMVAHTLYRFPEWLVEPQYKKNMFLVATESTHCKSAAAFSGSGEPTAYLGSITEKFASSGYEFKNTWFLKQDAIENYKNNNYNQTGGKFNNWIKPLVRDKIMNNPEYLQKFKDGEWTYTELKNLISNDDAYSSTVDLVWAFAQPEYLDNMINEAWVNTGDAEYDLWYNRLIYLDVLLSISRLTSDSYQHEIDEYLQHHNGNSARMAIFPVISPVICIGDNYKPPLVYSLPMWYTMLSGSTSAEEFMTVVPSMYTKHTVEEQMAGNFSQRYYTRLSESRDIIKDCWEQYCAIAKGGKKKGDFGTFGGVDLTMMSNSFWWSEDCPPHRNSAEGYGRYATLCLPTDLRGKASGTIGFTYFAFGGGDEQTLPDPRPEFEIAAKSNQNKVSLGEKVGATININCKNSKNKKVMSDMKDFFTYQTKQGYPKAKLTIQYEFESLEGNGSSAKIIDTRVKPTGSSVSNTANKVVIKDIDWKTMEKYLKGKQIIAVVDKDIMITGETVNKYIGSVTLTWDDGQEIKFETKNKTKVNKYKGYDTVEWRADQLEVNKAHYYSNIRDDNYVEIKEGTPGNESFEAMAGVPTTENLYVGFGATEFMINEDLEMKMSDGTRKYTYKYTVPNCIESDTKCTWYCPGHTVSVPSHKIKDAVPEKKDSQGNVIQSAQPAVYCGGASKSGSCSSGSITLTATCPCGTSKTQTFKASGGDSIGKPCKGIQTGKTCSSGSGCCHTQQINEAHPHAHTFTGVITQPINSFTYMDITDLALWRVNELNYEGNPELLSNPNHKWDPGTGFWSFYNQEGYSNATNPQTGKSGNGRLVFFVTKSQFENNVNIYGDTEYTCPDPDSTCMLKTKADQVATKWMNDTIAGEKVKAMVVSDYVSLCTTEGYQTPAYHDYNSDEVTLTTNTFSTGSDNKSIAGTTITFSELPTWDDFWASNSKTAAKWTEDHITRSGYNGEYSTPSTKWYNTNAVSSTNAVKKLIDYAAVIGCDHPNSVNHKPTRTDFKTGFNNLRMTKTGLNIIDSTDTATKAWSASDGIEPVSNGEWDTGVATLTAKQYINFNDWGGTDWGTESNGDMVVEVGYNSEDTELNDIVVHNPTSVQYATVISNDEKYDLRTAASLAEGGDPGASISSVCPRNETCQFQHLICSATPAPHTDACYQDVATNTIHVGGFNTHEHTQACYADCLTFNVKGSTIQTVTLPAGWYYFDIAGAQGGADASVAGIKGRRLTGYYQFTEKTTIQLLVGNMGASNVSGTGGGWPGGQPAGRVGASGAGGGYTAVRNASGTNLFYAGGGRGGCNSNENQSANGGDSDGAGQGGANGGYLVGNLKSMTSYGAYNAGNGYIKIYSATGTHVHVSSCYKNVTCGGHYYWNGWDSSIDSYKLTCGSCGYWINNDDGGIANSWIGKYCDRSVRRLNCNGSIANSWTKGGAPQYYDSNGNLVGSTGCQNELNAHVCTSYTQTVAAYWCNRSNISQASWKTFTLPAGEYTFHASSINYSDKGVNMSGKFTLATETEFEIYISNYIQVQGNGVEIYAESGISSDSMGDSYTIGCSNVSKGRGGSDTQASITFFKKVSDCQTITQKVLVCDDPHHYDLGEPWNYDDTKNHWEYGDARCWAPCGNDNNHKTNVAVTLPGGQQQSSTDIFVNLDREIRIYYPSTGDFAQSPSMHGIATTTNIRGMGYYDNMDISKWTRDRYITFPFDVIARDENGEFSWQFYANEELRIDLITSDYDVTGNPADKDFWTFYIPLSNSEMMNASVRYDAIATNAREVVYYSENDLETNRDRYSDSKVDYAAYHTAFKKQAVDVLGYIGSLTMNDTGDFRFATLFKKEKNDGTWLVNNLVPNVNYKLPNKVVSDRLDVRQEVASDATDWHSTYGMTYAQTGGKAHPYVSLPLVAAKSNVTALQEELLRPGYNMYMDVETVGNYYGENTSSDESGDVCFYVDSDLTYKMQITPRYWMLDLDTGQYTPVDAYMGVNNEYTPVAYFDNADYPSEHYLYLNWLEESSRRNYTSKEKDATSTVSDILTNVKGVRTRTPIAGDDVLGTASRLFLNDINRTFIGSSLTYGVDRNPQDATEEYFYNRQSQRWHFTLGLPSSTVFVKANEPCTDVNIKEVQDANAVIVCTINIKVRGEVWTLEYDGTPVNYSDGVGFKIFEGGPVYQPPKEPGTTNFTKDPIVAVYTNKYTAADDLRTEGSH